MDKELARSAIDEKLCGVHTGVNALKCATKVVRDAKAPDSVEMMEIWSMITIIVDSIEHELEKGSEELADYFKSWGA